MILFWSVTTGPAGQIANNDNADDVRDVDLSQVHFSPARWVLKALSPAIYWWWIF